MPSLEMKGEEFLEIKRCECINSASNVYKGKTPLCKILV